jgi:cell division protein FtsA
MSKYVVAIDLGTTKLVSIVGEKTAEGRYRILACSEARSAGIRRGQVENVASVIEALIPTLEKIKSDTGIPEINEVYVGIAGLHITCIVNRTEISRNVYEEMITEDEVKLLETNAQKIHLNAGEEVLHAIPQTYSIDGVDDITDPVGRLGNKLIGHFHVIIGNTASKVRTDVCMRQLDLSLQKLILEPIASARATLSPEEKEMGVAMIDMGGGTTDLIVYNGGVIRYTAVIPLGGNVITEDIKNGCRILYDQAEKAKTKYGSCVLSSVGQDKIVVIPGVNGRESREIPSSTLALIINARLDEIITMVMREIEKGQCGTLNAGIVFTGGVSKMKGIEEFLRTKTKMEVKIGKPDYVSTDSSNEIIHPKYSTAVGLIMCGFDHLESMTVTTPSLSPTPPLPPPPPPPPTPPGGNIWETVTNWVSGSYHKFMNPRPDEE